jgi:Tfp pilus assembly major pilin PilA
LKDILWIGNWAFQCDFSDRNIGKISVPVDECESECEKRSICTHFTWIDSYDGGVCWFKGGPITKEDAFLVDSESGQTTICGIPGFDEKNNDETTTTSNPISITTSTTTTTTKSSIQSDVFPAGNVFNYGRMYTEKWEDYGHPDYITIWLNTIRSGSKNTDFDPVKMIQYLNHLNRF